MYHCNIAVKITFIPSPNIGVYQLAHYQCSVDNTGVTITWNVNDTLSTNSAIIQLDIVTVGAASSSSNLTIPGYPKYNNTVVTCLAAGFVDGNVFINSTQSILIIQGMNNITNTKIIYIL